MCGAPPSTSPINRSTPIYNSLQLEKRSLALFSFFFVFRAGWRYSLVTWPRTLGRSPLLLSSLLVKVLEVSIPESLVALSWLPCRSASQDHSSSWGPPTLVPPSKRTVFFPLLSVNLMDTPHTHRDTKTIGDWCLCVCVYLVVSRHRDPDFAIRSDRVIELDVWSDTIDNTARVYDIYWPTLRLQAIVRRLMSLRWSGTCFRYFCFWYIHDIYIDIYIYTSIKAIL